MLIEKFSDYNKPTMNSNKTIVEYLQPILDKIEKGFVFKFAATSVFCFGKKDVSILLFEQDSYLNIQKLFNKSNKLSSNSGYNIYKIDKNLENPFFNNNNQYLESHFYFTDKDYFKKVKYFISKIMSIADELNHYPCIKWDSNKIVEIKIMNHESNSLSEKDFLLSERISEVWYNLI